MNCYYSLFTLWVISLVNQILSATIVPSESHEISSSTFLPASNVDMAWLSKIDNKVPYDVSFYYPTPYSTEVLNNTELLEQTRTIHKSILCPIYKNILKHVLNNTDAPLAPNFTEELGVYHADNVGGVNTTMPIVLTDNESYYVGVMVSSAVKFPVLIASRLVKDLSKDVNELIQKKMVELKFDIVPVSIVNSYKDCPL